MSAKVVPAGIGTMLLVLGAGPQAGRPFDLVIRRGTVIDGTGAPGAVADLGIRTGRIAAVGRLSGARAAEVVDARGLVVAPGFIDVHTHADDLDAKPAAENFLRMGVTTIVVGNCGSSVSDVAAAFSRMERAGIAINVATLVGHNTVRRAVMGTAQRAPTPDELERMKALVGKAMADGAVGLSTGLQYVPGAYAEAAEISQLAKVAAEHGGLYASHMRNEGTEIEKAVAETIAVGEAARCPVQISHLKIDSPNRWGASANALKLIDEARARGVDVRADQYVYTAASSTLGIRFPSWVLEGGQAKITERLDDGATWARIRTEMQQLLAERGLADYSFAVVASYPADPSLNGKSIKQIAALRQGRDDIGAQLEVLREMLRAGGASMVYHFMSEDDITRIMRHREVAFASDSSVLTFGEGVPHPRGYGNNARVLARYVREQQVISLEEAIRKMTSLPAGHFRFADRGVIKVGAAADLVVFDPRRIADRATFDQPHRHPEGIVHVFVNGQAVVKDGKPTGARPGQILRGTGRQGKVASAGEPPTADAPCAGYIFPSTSSALTTLTGPSLSARTGPSIACRSPTITTRHAAGRM